MNISDINFGNENRLEIVGQIQDTQGNSLPKLVVHIYTVNRYITRAIVYNFCLVFVDLKLVRLRFDSSECPTL